MNTFGQGYVQGESAPLLFPIYDPREVRTNRSRFRRDAISALARANSFYCPVGRYPSRGWVLMRRGDLNRLNRYSRTLQLDIGNTNAPHNVGSLHNLAIVQAQCVTRGLATDTDALYLVELTDARGLLHNKWFSFPVATAYNIRAPGYPSTDRGGTFYRSSMNTGVSPVTTWTWETMARNLWEQMSAFLGAWPGLPTTPDGTPEGHWYPGVSAWNALCDVLEHLGMVVVANLQNVAIPYTIVVDGAADASLAATQALYRPVLEDDLEWIDAGAGRVPYSVKVMFRRRGGVYGTEETTPYRNDAMAQQWSMPTVYSVTVTVADLGLTQFEDAVGTHHIWSDFTVRYDQDNTVVTADATYATTLAKQRVRQYFGRIDPSQYLSQTYAGARPFVTGSRVDGVCWYQDYSDQARQGWKTQIVHGPNPPWPNLWD